MVKNKAMQCYVSDRERERGRKKRATVTKTEAGREKE